MMTISSEAPCYETFAAADTALAGHGRSFHWARRLLGKNHANRATRLYGFCRHLDDIVDEAPSSESAGEQLERVRRDMASGTSRDPVVRDCLLLMAECRIDPAIAGELLNGLASDLEPVRMKDDAELIRYCYRVAGTVGLMMCGVLDVHHPAAHCHAVDLGIAMQLTNICRDIAEDAAHGRRYLPATLIGNCPAEDLVFPCESLQPQIRKAVAELLQKADTYYRSGEHGLPYLPTRARFGILAAARVYRAIGERLRARDHAYWLGRAMVTDRRKAAITALALAAAPMRPSFWWASSPHEHGLHWALRGLPGIGGTHEN